MKSITTWANQNEDLVDTYLLMEDGSYLLQESGFKLILEQSVAVRTIWANLTRN